MLLRLLRRFVGALPELVAKGAPGEAVQAGNDAIVALIRSGRTADAEQLLRERIDRSAEDADALHLLGLLFYQAGRTVEALPLLERAVRLEPEVAFMRSNFAEALRVSGQLERAETEARTAVRLDPGEPDTLFNLAAVLSARYKEAAMLPVLDDLLAIDPGHAAAHSLKADVLFRDGQFAAAITHAEAACRLQPGNVVALASLMRMRASVCDWANRDDDVARLRRLLEAQVAVDRPIASGKSGAQQAINPFVVYEYPLPERLRRQVTDQHVRQIRESAGPGLGPLVLTEVSTEASTGDVRAASGRRLRIGYLSADFHSHPTMHLMASFFALHDRAAFEVIAYSIGGDDGSAYRRRAVDTVDRFVDIRAESPRQTAERIRADRIDILVDLKGFTHEARPAILALRAAPLQMAWLGYPATTGRGLNDYAIVDHVTVPPDLEEQFGEALIRMPHSYQVNDHRQPIAPDGPQRAALGLPERAIVYACFNQPYKIEPAVFATWMRILARVPDSVLWLYEGNQPACDNLRREARAQGVEPHRLHFGGTLDKPQHLARLRCADLFLDTGSINAHTSASDALWAGVPVLTCMGDAFPARVAGSLVCAVGMPQMACATLEEYERMAVHLGMHAHELQALRVHLEAKAALPLFDTPRFVRILEGAYRQAWQRHLAGRAPASFDALDMPG